MAKREGTIAATTEHKIEGFAEDLSKMLGSAKSKAEGWLSQRHAIVKHLSDIRDTASELLNQLGHQAESIVRRGRPAGSKNRKAGIIIVGGRVISPKAVVNKLRVGRPAASGKKTRTMSAEGRARIAAAQKARWAKVKAAEKKK